MSHQNRKSQLTCRIKKVSSKQHPPPRFSKRGLKTRTMFCVYTAGLYLRFNFNFIFLDSIVQEIFRLKHFVRLFTFYFLYYNYRICQLSFQSWIFIFWFKLIKTLLNDRSQQLAMYYDCLNKGGQSF